MGTISTLMVWSCLCPGSSDVVIAYDQITRYEYFRRIQKVNIGMPMKSVEEILGKPDAIWTREDDDPIDNQNIDRVWCYGSKSRRSFPTLGRVAFRMDGKVYSITGKDGPPIAKGIMEEVDLRRLLEAIDDGPRSDFREYCPFQMLSLANVFQPLGQKMAFAVFREYERVAGNCWPGGRDTIELLLSCMHEIPDNPGSLPIIVPGWQSQQPPSDRHLCPRYPIRFIDGIPFLLATMVRFTGERLPVTCDLEKYEGQFTWISAPYRISSRSASDIRRALVEFSKTNEWYLQGARVGGAVQQLESQIISFVRSRKTVQRKKYGDSE